MENIKEIEAKLVKSAGDVHSVEELYKPIGTQEELESIRAVGLEVEVTNDRLEKINNEFKLEKKVLNDKIPEAEQSHNFDLEEHDAFLFDDIKQQNNVDINKAFNVSWCDEQKMPMENIKEIEAELAKSAGDVHSVEEFYKSIGTQEELESIRAMGLEAEVANDGLEKINNEFKLEKEVLNDQTPEAKQSRNFDLQELDALLSDDIKQQNIFDINEALNVSWCDEQKMPMENIKEIKAELAKSAGDVHSVEELYKPIGTQEELESIRAVGLEVEVTNDRLEKINNEFKLEKEVLKDKIPEAKQNHNFDLEELDAFLSDDIKQQNIVYINKAFNVNWCDEQKMPMENIKEIEAELAKSAGEVHSVEEFYKSIGTREELESISAMGLEVEVANDGLEKINNEFKLEKEVLNDQTPEAKKSRNFDLQELDALLSDDIKQQNIVDINEALNASWCDEQKIPMENIKEIEAELAKSAGDVHSVEELYKPIGTQEELESIRAVGQEVEVTNDRLEKINNEFKLEKEVLNDKILEAKQSHNFDLEELDALLSDDIKQKNIVDINKAFNISWCDEQKMPMENSKEIEAELAKSAGDVNSVEGIYKSIGTQEVLESIRAMGLEVEVANDGFEKISNEFKLEKEVLNDQIPQAKQSCNFDLEELNALLSDDIKQQNIVDINEALNVSWCDEMKMPMENIKEIEAELAKSVADVHSVEELYKPIGTQELESQRTMRSKVVTNNGLEKINNEFKLGKDVLNDRILEVEQSHDFDLKEHDALLPDGIKQQNIVAIIEALNGSWSDEQVMSMENIKEIEAELAISAGDVHTVEEFYKPISTQEELESIRAMGSEKLEIDKVNAKKMEEEIIKLGNELTEVHAKVEENNEATTHTVSRDLSSKTQVRSPKNLLSFSKEDLKAKLMYLDEIERNLKEKDKELPKSNTENEAFQRTMEDLKIKLLLKEEHCIQLEAKLHWANKNIAKTESLLQEALSSKHELEQELAEKSAERLKLEDLTMIQGKSLSEYENLVSALQNEAKFLRAKLEDIEEKLEASGVQEKELHEKLRNARDELEQQLKATEEASTRYLNLKTLHETSAKNLELELEEADKNFKQKVYEAKELKEKLKSLEDHVDYFKGQAIETAQSFTSLKIEMESNATKVLSFVHNIEGIKQKASNDAKIQRELKENKDLEWEALLKKSRAELKAKHQYATVLEKQVKGLEKKLQEAESQYEVKATKQSEELLLINEEVNELREKFSQTSEIKKKISELEEKLKPAFTSGEETSSTKANNKNIVSEIKEVKSTFLDIAKLLERKNKKGKALEISLKQASRVSVKPFCPKALRIILVFAVISLIVGVTLQMIHHYD